jgi:predicted nuclease with TOPRIM domain
MAPKENSNDKKQSFYVDLPNWSKVLLQLGFAGVIAVLFVMDSRDRSDQLRRMAEENRLQAREDRSLFRDELKAQRDTLSEAVREMRRAVDKLDEQHRSLKKDVEGLKPPFGSAPFPHSKVPD